MGGVEDRACLGWLVERASGSGLPAFVQAMLAHLSAATGAETTAVRLDGDQLRFVTTSQPTQSALRELAATLADPDGSEEMAFLHRFRLRATSGTLFMGPLPPEAHSAAAKVVGHALALLDVVAELETARAEAAHDPLTGLLNRRAMSRAIGRALAESARHGNRCFTLVMIDLDHFKWFNDSFGHLAGDELLVELGRVLERSLRSSDLSCRWGGDEFLLMLPQTEPDQADLLLRRLKIELRGFLNPYEHDGIELGFSSGVARHPDDGSDLDSLLRRADERLYEAKSRLDERRREFT